RKRLVLVLKGRNIGDRRADRDGCAASSSAHSSSGGDRRIGHRHRKCHSRAGTGERESVESTSGKAKRTIKKYIVPDGILKEESDAPRIEVLPRPEGSHANPACGAKSLFGCRTEFPNPGTRAFNWGR